MPPKRKHQPRPISSESSFTECPACQCKVITILINNHLDWDCKALKCQRDDIKQENAEDKLSTQWQNDVKIESRNPLEVQLGHYEQLGKAKYDSWVSHVCDRNQKIKQDVPIQLETSIVSELDRVGRSALCELDKHGDADQIHFRFNEIERSTRSKLDELDHTVCTEDVESLEARSNIELCSSTLVGDVKKCREMFTEHDIVLTGANLECETWSVHPAKVSGYDVYDQEICSLSMHEASDLDLYDQERCRLPVHEARGYAMHDQKRYRLSVHVGNDSTYPESTVELSDVADARLDWNGRNHVSANIYSHNPVSSIVMSNIVDSQLEQVGNGVCVSYHSGSDIALSTVADRDLDHKGSNKVLVDFNAIRTGDSMGGSYNQESNIEWSGSADIQPNNKVSNKASANDNSVYIDNSVNCSCNPESNITLSHVVDKKQSEPLSVQGSYHPKSNIAMHNIADHIRHQTMIEPVTNYKQLDITQQNVSAQSVIQQQLHYHSTVSLNGKSSQGPEDQSFTITGSCHRPSDTELQSGKSLLSSEANNSMSQGRKKSKWSFFKAPRPLKVPNGHYVLNDFISEKEEIDLIHFLDMDTRNPWRLSTFNGLHMSKAYGLKTDLKNRCIKPATFKMPEIVFPIFEKLRDSMPVLKDFWPNETNAIDYCKSKGHWLKPHVDDRQLSGTVLVNFSLCGDCKMSYERERGIRESFKVLLRRRCVQILTADCRYNFTHSIYNEDLLSPRRVSMTFRQSVLP